MKIRVLIAAMCLTFLFGVLAHWQIAYHQVRDEIHVGMSYQGISEKRVGEPVPYFYDKGPFRTRWTIIGRQELWVYFSDNKVSSMSINRYIGTQNHFYRQAIRYENINK